MPFVRRVLDKKLRLRIRTRIQKKGNRRQPFAPPPAKGCAPPKPGHTSHGASRVLPRGAACSNIDTRPCATTLGGPEGGWRGEGGVGGGRGDALVIFEYTDVGLFAKTMCPSAQLRSDPNIGSRVKFFYAFPPFFDSPQKREYFECRHVWQKEVP